MKFTRLFSIAALAAVLFAACSEPQHDSICVIPQPNEVALQQGCFDFSRAVIGIEGETDARTLAYLTSYAESRHALQCEGTQANVFFSVDSSLPAEAYTLEVSESGIKAQASGLNGFVYAVQTLRQLTAQTAIIPCMKVKDAPRFSYRGMHLDCSRHFFSLDEVRRYLDIMELHKLNTLHWHLTDDQGWRLEIKKYPLLTEVGAWRNGTHIGKTTVSDNIRYGGYYTQDEVRDIVEYAASKGITIVPEIDLPGHMLAAITAYPELGCTGGPYAVWGQWGVSEDVLCVGKEHTFEFIEDVLEEVMELFPSKYIHIGGDECPKNRWKECPACQAKIAELGITGTDEFAPEFYLQSYVTKRMEEFLSQHGRSIIGWDEILEGEISPNATIMSWRGAAGGIQAANMGHDAIMTPNSYLYFDYYQAKDNENEPLAFGGCLPIDRVYSYEPYDEKMTPENRKHVIGVQANLWTEYIPTDAQLEYMLLPRLSALSEVQWCQPEVKNWKRFVENMPVLREIFDECGYNYATHVFSIDPDAVDEVVALEHKGRGKKASLNTTPHLNYTFHAPDELLDGLFGDMSFISGAWIGWEGEKMDVTINMKKEEFSSVTIETLVDKGGYIFDATGFQLYTSKDGSSWALLALDEYPCDGPDDPDGIRRHTISLDSPVKTKYLRVVAETIPTLPEWHGGFGAKAFLFVDEIIVE